MLNHTKNGPIEELCTAIFAIWRKYPTKTDIYKDTWETNNLQQTFPQVYSWIEENALPTDIHNKSYSKWTIHKTKRSNYFRDLTVLSQKCTSMLIYIKKGLSTGKFSSTIFEGWRKWLTNGHQYKITLQINDLKYKNVQLFVAAEETTLQMDTNT